MFHKIPEMPSVEDDFTNALFTIAAEKEREINKPVFTQANTKALYQATKNIYKFAKKRNLAAIEQIYNQNPDIDVVNIAHACAINNLFSSENQSIATLSSFVSQELRSKIAEIIDNPKNNGLVGELSFKLQPLLSEAAKVQGYVAAFNLFRTPTDLNERRAPVKKPYERKLPQAKL